MAGARLRLTEPDGSVREIFVEFTRSTDGFRFLEFLEDRLGGPVRAPDRDLRWQALMVKRAAERKAAEKKRRR